MILMDWVTLVSAMLVGGYVIAARRISLFEHGAGSAAMHVGVAGVCAAAANSAMHANSGFWLVAVTACAVWLADSHGRWKNARPQGVRKQIAKAHAERWAARR